MEINYVLVARKAAWAIVLTIGLAVAYYGGDVILHESRKFISMPKSEAPTPAPAAESQALRLPPVAIATGENNVAKNRVGVIQPKPIPESPETYPIMTATPPKEKDWTEYGDKIVGWLVALAGAYKLIQKSPIQPSKPVKRRS